ncbi:hypothetical protein LOTGIDRAFT_125271 [Lottia gigantea]|uniref:Mitochondrial import inner membrane translocase subunit n=1 Tax=Lottia gigantea TaxID=225164 RepID=V3ZE82_LOTGI|nr:hypothetical protein LOTGIDRAFT_125271 [Lottia gigantea]ESO89433.1 hypothetical protein LOTGIDRAFT_125271 [Lottia gigantea]
MDPEMKKSLETEVQKNQLRSQFLKLTDACWDTCMDKPRDKLDSRTEGCFINCVDRFVDTNQTVVSRFANMVQQQQSGFR